MKKIDNVVNRARYEIIKTILKSRNQWDPNYVQYAVVYDAADGGSGAIEPLHHRSQLNENFYKERPHLNRDTVEFFNLNHTAKTAE